MESLFWTFQSAGVALKVKVTEILSTLFALQTMNLCKFDQSPSTGSENNKRKHSYMDTDADRICTIQYVPTPTSLVGGWGHNQAKNEEVMLWKQIVSTLHSTLSSKNLKNQYTTSPCPSSTSLVKGIKIEVSPLRSAPETNSTLAY